MMFYVSYELGNDEWFDLEEFEDLESALAYARELLRQYDRSYCSISIYDEEGDDYEHLI